MKRLVFLFISLAFLIKVNAQQTESFKDPRDGNIYKTIKIGNQLWMAENLAFEPSSGNYWVYENNIDNVPQYGYLYNWETARKVCPAGWHLPSDEEWTELANFLGKDAGAKMKSTSGWDEDGNGTNESGFSGLPGGYRASDGTSFYILLTGCWWSTMEDNTDFDWGRLLGYSSGFLSQLDFRKESGLSVRCLRD
jgi:uncharacterized protein (TIGR02145 family)